MWNSLCRALKRLACMRIVCRQPWLRVASAGPAVSAEADRHFLSQGVQYYISGRSAALAGQIPVCGNLFHHAIEMLLKARLTQRVPLVKLQNKFRHRLPRIWRAFKQEFPSANLAQFDAVIVQLDRFERIRYPDKIMEEGASVLLEWERSHYSAISGPGLKMPPAYRIVVNDIDRFVVEIFKVCSWNPLFFTDGLNQYARDATRRENPVGEALTRK